MKRYNTPHRSRVVKTRMTEEEYAAFAERLSAYHMSQAEFIRQAITGAAIRPLSFHPHLWSSVRSGCLSQGVLFL